MSPGRIAVAGLAVLILVGGAVTLSAAGSDGPGDSGADGVSRGSWSGGAST